MSKEFSQKAVDMDSTIMAGVLRVQRANCADMVPDVNGKYPACKNKLGTWECERCGRDVRGVDDACPAVPTKKRWSFIENQ